ncbi:MAG: hypothetical protein PHN18_04200 [Sulfurospirillaceae bacterium]|jgi:type III secretory pathway component EscU|nr:hypothetical protein [Sulfurospirillaceae bacterium]MDD2825388.1 hypothetical protein [Sulfurospirillaceae bacterium]
MPPILKILFYLLLLFGLEGCDDFISSKKYTDSFTLDKPFALHVDTMLPYSLIEKSFYAHGFLIDATSQLNVNVTTNSEAQYCSLSASTSVQENFIRISIVKNNKEIYRIQCNQKEEITSKTIEKIVKKLKEDLN